MTMILKTGQSFSVPVYAVVDDNGAHGALTIKKATLQPEGGSAASVLPADAILREEAHPVNPAKERTVSGAPAYGAGAGTGGKNIYTITVTVDPTGEIGAGDFIRSKTAGKGGVYKVDTITTTEIKVFANTGEMDVVDTDVVEKVTPEGVYKAVVEVTFADLAGAASELEIEVDGKTTAQRGNSPGLSAEVNDRKTESFLPWTDAARTKVF